MQHRCNELTKQYNCHIVFKPKSFCMIFTLHLKTIGIVEKTLSAFYGTTPKAPLSNWSMHGTTPKASLNGRAMFGSTPKRSLFNQALFGITPKACFFF